jgi:hypothetical protein
MSQVRSSVLLHGYEARWLMIFSILFHNLHSHIEKTYNGLATNHYDFDIIITVLSWLKFAKLRFFSDSLLIVYNQLSVSSK